MNGFIRRITMSNQSNSQDFSSMPLCPAGYANNCLATYSEGPPNAASRRATDRLDALLAQSPYKTVDAFWREVRRNRFERAGVCVYTRPQVMIFTKI
jgi:hypothetical protein